MKILSVRKGFLADHSSTSYEFLAVDTPLDKKAKESVSRLSSRVRPTSRRASFIYHGDFADLRGGWEPLMTKYYDVMYSESYDWWTLAMAFDANKKQLSQLERYSFSGEDDLGVYAQANGNRAIVSVHCVLQSDAFFSLSEDRYDENEDNSSDEILDMLRSIRKQIRDGDYSALYAVWEKYGVVEEEAPPEPKKYGRSQLAKQFKGILASL